MTPEEYIKTFDDAVKFVGETYCKKSHSRFVENTYYDVYEFKEVFLHVLYWVVYDYNGTEKTQGRKVEKPVFDVFFTTQQEMRLEKLKKLLK